ncbi:hypothetical protein MKY29_04125 [Psychrobacillus sp. FSL K6-2365]|uniref:hypothetical protein n=1 Tax=Psychrobacillus sp. FSL K6-2365 TaxID=2921546 RepID=UPI0030F81F2D
MKLVFVRKRIDPNGNATAIRESFTSQCEQFYGIIILNASKLDTTASNQSTSARVNNNREQVNYEIGVCTKAN